MSGTNTRDDTTTTLPARVEDIGPRWLQPTLAAARLVDANERIELEVSRVGEDRGFTGSIARVRWRSRAAATRTGVVVIKLPDAAANFERCAREVRFYEELWSICGVRVPRPLFARADADGPAVAIVLVDVPGVDGDAAVGCSVDRVAALLVEIARMHAWWWEQPLVTTRRPDWLPRWGIGTSNAAAPHRRSADRYRKHLAPFFERHGRAAPPRLVDLAGSIAPQAESLFEAVAAGPITLVHADLHLDNVIFAGGPRGTPVVLDWQSVSAGPPLYDVTRLLVDALRGAAGAAVLGDLLDLYAARLEIESAGRVRVGNLRARFADMTRRVLVGVVSGYGGREPGTLHPREREMLRQAMSMDGLAGMVLAAQRLR